MAIVEQYAARSPAARGFFSSMSPEQGLSGWGLAEYRYAYRTIMHVFFFVMSISDNHTHRHALEKT